MKKILLSLFLAICGYANSQSAYNLILNIRYSSFCNTTASHPIVYLVCHDTLVSKHSPFPDGSVGMTIPNDNDYKDAILLVSHYNGCIYRIRLSSLLCHKEPITIDDLVLYVVKIEPTEHYSEEIKTIPSNMIRSTMQSYHSKASIQKMYGDNHWYFPETKLVYKGISHDDFIYQYINLESYQDSLGHYPTEQELDSLIEEQLAQDAEGKAGMYSNELAQLNEPVLWDNYPKNAYRLDWYSGYYYTFNPYSIRIEPNSIGSAMMLFSYRMIDICEDNRLYCDIIPLDSTSYSSFIELFNKLSFWSLNSVLDNEVKNVILEANVDGQYHVIFRGEGEDPALEELQRFLWSLTGLGENKIVHRKIRIE